MARLRPTSQVRLLERWASNWRPENSAAWSAVCRRSQLRMRDPAVAGEAAACRARARRGPPRQARRPVSASVARAPCAGLRRSGAPWPSRPCRPARVGAAGDRGPRRRSRARRLRQALGDVSSRTPSPGSAIACVQEAASTTTGSSPSSLQRRGLDHLIRLVAVGGVEALRSPRQAATAPTHLVRDPERKIGPPRDLDQSPGQARPIGGRAEDAVGAGGEVDGRGARPLGRRQSGRGRPAAPCRGRPPRDRPTEPQRRARSGLDPAPVPCPRQRQAFGTLAVAGRTQFLHQLAGVDPDWACELTGAVGGAGVQHVVGELVLQGTQHRRARRLARYLAPQQDPLAWRRGQMPARADRLAEAALDAGRRGVLDRRRRFQVAKVDSGSRLRTTPGASMPSGSASRFNRHISSVAFGPHSRST